jgi:zinc/manganese transport system substrate-binding protein
MFALPAHAAIKVFACEPEWASLARELGGDAVTVYAATTARQDPHRIEARPSLIAQMRRAELVVCTGAELEIGWLPVLLADAANPAVRPGQPGYFEASAFVTLRDKPTRLDRADGDVHAAGNPHVHTDPRNIARIAVALSQRLTAIDPANAALYRARGADFATRWQAATARWTAQGKRLAGQPVAVQHTSFSYLVDWLGLKVVAVLEPKPGVEPSVGHLATLAARMQATPPRAVLRAAYQSARASDWIAARIGAPVVVLPYTVGGGDTRDLFGLYDATLAALLKAMP